MIKKKHITDVSSGSSIGKFPPTSIQYEELPANIYTESPVTSTSSGERPISEVFYTEDRNLVVSTPETRQQEKTLAINKKLKNLYIK